MLTIQLKLNFERSWCKSKRCLSRSTRALNSRNIRLFVIFRINADHEFLGDNLTWDTSNSPHPSPLPRREREPETSLLVPAPLLPTWEKGLGDEGFSLLPLGIFSCFSYPDKHFQKPCLETCLIGGFAIQFIPKVLARLEYNHRAT
jgi:hypothetical protein